MTARRWFHLMLGAIFVPLVSLPLVWGFALHSLRRAADPEARRWARRMLALAVIDTLVVIVVGGLVAGETESIEPGAAPEDRVVIGVMPDRSFEGSGARIEQVLPGGPAAAAGFQPGDIVIRIAGEEISRFEELRRRVGELPPGVPVPFDVTRGPSTIAGTVTPQRSSEISRGKVELLEPLEGGGACFPPVSAIALLPTALSLAAIAALGVLVTRGASARGSARGVWWTGLALAAGSAASYAAPAGACVLLGGQTAAGPVFSLWGSSLALGSTAWLGWRVVGERQASDATRTWSSTVALGAWYLITGTPRLGVLLLALTTFAHAPEAGTHPLESVAQGLGSAGGVPGLLLLAVPGVLFAPVGEELAFRGLLQPALGAWLRPAGAVALTSLLFASMHWYYGLKLPLLVLIAAVLGWARIASGGVRAPIVLHMLVNAAGFLPVLLKVAGER